MERQLALWAGIWAAVVVVGYLTTYIVAVTIGPPPAVVSSLLWVGLGLSAGRATFPDGRG